MVLLYQELYRQKRVAVIGGSSSRHHFRNPEFFILHIAHELVNPLNLVQGWSSLHKRCLDLGKPARSQFSFLNNTGIKVLNVIAMLNSIQFHKTMTFFLLRMCTKTICVYVKIFINKAWLALWIQQALKIQMSFVIHMHAITWLQSPLFNFLDFTVFCRLIIIET